MNLNNHIIDVNVIKTANGENSAFSLCCMKKCNDFIKKFKEDSFVLMIDESNEKRSLIFEEYKKELPPKGDRNSIGNQFLLWILQNLYNSKKINRIEISKIEDKQGKTWFKEIPDIPCFKDFDEDDRKYIAVALKNPEKFKPIIVNATDNDWLRIQDELKRNGVEMNQLCFEELRK